MGINSTEVSYGFGQLGSVFTASTSTAITPPTGKVFVAVMAVDDCTFDNTSGLVASNDSAGAGLEYIGTGAAAHDSGGNASSGTGGQAITSTNFTLQGGSTIYGRWTSVNLTSGSVIAYIGD